MVRIICMITIQLDPALEQRLRRLAESRGQDLSQLAQRVLEEFLDVQAWNEDSEDDWANASVAMTPEILADDQWSERDANESR